MRNTLLALPLLGSLLFSGCLFTKSKPNQQDPVSVRQTADAVLLLKAYLATEFTQGSAPEFDFAAPDLRTVDVQDCEGNMRSVILVVFPSPSGDASALVALREVDGKNVQDGVGISTGNLEQAEKLVTEPVCER